MTTEQMDELEQIVVAAIAKQLPVPHTVQDLAVVVRQFALELAAHVLIAMHKIDSEEQD